MNYFKYIVALHGDEPLPVKALADNEIDHIIGNPRALELGKRFIDRDLNKSFGLSGDSYEEKRAVELLEQLKETDIVIDFHTTSSITQPFAIVVDEDMIPLAKTLGVGHIVHMKMNIKNGNALINHRSGVSVEAGNHQDKQSMETVIRAVECSQKGIASNPKIYEVYDKIVLAGDYRNFEEHTDGYFPVLAGEKAYDFYGLKARLIS